MDQDDGTMMTRGILLNSETGETWFLENKKRFKQEQE